MAVLSKFLKLSQRLLLICTCLYAVGLNIGMAPMSIGVALVLLGVLINLGPRDLMGRIRKNLQDRWLRRFAWAALALFTAIVVSLLVAVLDPHEGWCQRPWYTHFAALKIAKHAWYLFLPFVTLVVLQQLGEEGRRRVLQFWIGSFVLVSLFALPQFFTGWPRNPSPVLSMPGFHQVYLFMGHHLSIASIIIFPFFITLDLLFDPKAREFRLFNRKFLWLGLVMGFVALMLTFSRTLWVALPMGLLFWFSVYWGKARYALGLAAALLLMGYFGSKHEVVQDRLGDVWSMRARVELWKSSIAFFEARPVTGLGFRSHNHHSHNYQLENRVNHSAERDGVRSRFVAEGKDSAEICQIYKEQSCKNYRHTCESKIFAGHAHNNLFQMLGETGLLGLSTWLIWAFLAVLLAYFVWRSPSGPSFGAGLLAAWLVFHLNGMTQVNAWESKVMHNMAWFIAWTLFFYRTRVERVRPGDLSGLGSGDNQEFQGT